MNDINDYLKCCVYCLVFGTIRNGKVLSIFFRVCSVLDYWIAAFEADLITPFGPNEFITHASTMKTIILKSFYHPLLQTCRVLCNL